MKINPDGTFEIKKGEKMPYICPKDGWPIPYEDGIVMVRCFHCGFIGHLDDFEREFEAGLNEGGPAPIKET